MALNFRRILLRLAVWTYTESTSAAQRTLLGRRWLSLRSLESLRQLTSSHPRWANSSRSCSTSIQCLLLSYKTDFHVLPHNHFHFLSCGQFYFLQHTHFHYLPHQHFHFLPNNHFHFLLLNHFHFLPHNHFHFQSHQLSDGL